MVVFFLFLKDFFKHTVIKNAIKVSEIIAEGSVSEVIIDDVGSLYEVGDTVTFTAQTVDTNVNAATGFVSMIGGGILQEGTTSDTILIEDGSTTHLEEFKIEAIVKKNY